MESSLLYVVPLSVLPLIYGGIAFLVANRTKAPAKLTFARMVIAALPSLLMLGVFYSLVIRVYWELGKWPPATIAWMEQNGLSPSLIRHANFADGCFENWIILSLVVWPVIFVLVLLIRRLRPLVGYLGVYSFSFVACLIVTHLAPTKFLDWWWD
jgi:hypothetical protein